MRDERTQGSSPWPSAASKCNLPVVMLILLMHYICKEVYILANKYKINTWVQLYERLGRQVSLKTKESRIIMKDREGNIIPLALIYDDNGANWWFEEVKE